MIISLRRLVEGVKLLLLFLVCTYVFYGIVSFCAEVIQPSDPYRQPHGKAVKVINMYDTPPAEEQAALSSHLEGMKERLMFYYWYGE